MKTYTEAIEYLYNRLPMFTRDGASAYKKDLDRTVALCRSLDNPQHKFKTIHVAGTNGKGSSSHMLASIFASAGYKTGLYTSPHLVDFRERIRINGHQIAPDFVIDFVNTQKDLIEEIQPSFFEVTVAMAFDYFAKEQVDIAIIEVGLGGRLDSTNIISPEVSLITNIGMDHMNLLGDTIEQIAFEKAGIIKSQTPVVISESNPLTQQVFNNVASSVNAPIVYADQMFTATCLHKDVNVQHIQVKQANNIHNYDLDLTGGYQLKNVVGVLCAVNELQNLGYTIEEEHIEFGLSHVQTLTGLQGRWQTISNNPLIICDTGHNEDGIKEVINNLNDVKFNNLHIVIGAMKDKDLSHMLPYLPKTAHYYFTQPDMPRAMSASELANMANSLGLTGKICGSVINGLTHAKEQYGENDLIFVGGSNFVVAEILQSIQK